MTWLKIVSDSKRWIPEEELNIMMFNFTNLEILFQKVEYKLQSLSREKLKNRIQVSVDLIMSMGGW